MSPLNIIFAGSGAFGLPTLRALHTSPHTLLHILSQPDRPAGRGKKLTPTPISQFALDHNLLLTRPENISSLTPLPRSAISPPLPPSSILHSPSPPLAPLPPCDLLIVIAFGQKIPESIVHHPRLGSINLHASLLPKYRGAAPINHAILNGETTTGNSVIRLAQKMDAGAILAQSHLAIGPSETAGELHDRLAEDGPSLILPLLDQLAADTATETPQDESKATLAPKLSRESATLDFAQPADQIVRRINALSPWPGCRVRILDADNRELSRATLLRAEPSPASSPTPPGNLSPEGSLTAGDHLTLSILEIQPEGKRPMPLAAFRNGHPWHPGLRLESIT